MTELSGGLLFYVAGCLTGTIAAVYLMQLTWQSGAEKTDCLLLRLVRRGMLGWVALLMTWSGYHALNDPKFSMMPDAVQLWTVVGVIFLWIVTIRSRLRRPTSSRAER